MSTQSRGKLSHWIAKEESPSTWNRLSKGIESLDNTKNAQTQENTWIDDSSESNTTGYQPSWSVSGFIYAGDPASEMLANMAWEDARNEDAELYMLLVREWVEGDTTGSYRAKRYACSWAPENEGGGTGGENVSFSGTLSAKGMPVHGEFDPATNTFTPDA